MRAVLFEGIGVGPADDVPAIDRAQDLVYEAWEAPSTKKRRELAKEALRASGSHRERASGTRARKVHGGSQEGKRVFANCKNRRKYLKLCGRGESNSHIVANTRT